MCVHKIPFWCHILLKYFHSLVRRLVRFRRIHSAKEMGIKPYLTCRLHGEARSDSIKDPLKDFSECVYETVIYLYHKKIHKCLNYIIIY